MSILMVLTDEERRYIQLILAYLKVPTLKKIYVLCLLLYIKTV